jgi:lysophospholipase L1-like esterase
MYNAGVGGTGSENGLYRLQRDVVSKDPDLVFIEFAVNDLLSAQANVTRDMEGIVRQLLNLPKKPVIIFVYTTRYDHLTAKAYHNEIADYYNIPVIDLDAYVWDTLLPELPAPPAYGDIDQAIKAKLHANYQNFSDDGKKVCYNLMYDAVHPNNAGYTAYSNYITDALANNEEAYFVLPTEQTNVYNSLGYDYVKPHLDSYLAGTYTGGWTSTPINKQSGYEGALTRKAGAYVDYTFYGRIIGIVPAGSAAGGTFSYIIDGSTGLSGTINTANASNVMGTQIIRRNLTDEEHTIRFTYSGTAAQDGIIAWFVSDSDYAAPLGGMLGFEEDFSDYNSADYTFSHPSHASLQPGYLKYDNANATSGLNEFIERSVVGDGQILIETEVKGAGNQSLALQIRGKFSAKNVANDGNVQEMVNFLNDGRGIYGRNPTNNTAYFFVPLSNGQSSDAAFSNPAIWHNVKILIDTGAVTTGNIRYFIDNQEAAYIDSNGNSIPYLSLKADQKRLTGVQFAPYNKATEFDIGYLKAVSLNRAITDKISALPQEPSIGNSAFEKSQTDEIAMLIQTFEDAGYNSSEISNYADYENFLTESEEAINGLKQEIITKIADLPATPSVSDKNAVDEIAKLIETFTGAGYSVSEITGYSVYETFSALFQELYNNLISADVYDNVTGNPIHLLYDNSENFGDTITEISINGTPLSSG